MTRRSWGRRFGPLFLSLGLLVAAELALRVAGFEFLAYSHYEKNDWGAFVEGRNRIDYLADPDVFWRFLPSRTIESNFGRGARINSHGFRGPEIAVAKDPSVRRVLTIGDSGTFGWAVSDEECYPRQLEALLNSEASRPRVEVVNAGVPGYTSLQGLRWLESHAIRVSPDLVIAAFGGNDSDVLEMADKDRKILPAALTAQGVLLRSRLYQLAYKAVAVRTHDVRTTGGGIERVSLEDFSLNLERILDVSEKAGARAVLLARPGPRYAEYMGAEAALAGKRGVPFVGDGIGGHPKGDGYRAVAERVARVIVENDLLRPPR
jgi:lysophospholipase L1-like esterase